MYIGVCRFASGLNNHSSEKNELLYCAILDNISHCVSWPFQKDFHASTQCCYIKSQVSTQIGFLASDCVMETMAYIN